MSRITIFTGPTLSSAQVHAIVPEAEVLPPVSAGDLLRHSFNAGDLVAIIDGFYFQAASVRHKEILLLLQRGVHVWGASSMGALRAAELALFGMRGIGRVFESYLSGEIEGDDEVALVHADEEMGNIHLTEALVNIRYACQLAQEASLLSTQECTYIIDSAATLPFFERAYPTILQRAQGQGLSERSAHTFLQFVQKQRPDLKQQDALALVEEMRTPPSIPFCPSFTLNETTFVRNWDVFSKGTALGEHLFLPDVDILTLYQLVGADYPIFHRQVLLQALKDIAIQEEDADRGGTTEEIVAQFIANKLHIRVDEPLPASLKRWLSAEELGLSSISQLTLLALRLWQEPRSVSWHKVIIDAIKASSLFYPLVQLAAQIQSFNEVLIEQHQSVDFQHLAPLQIYEWFLQRWHIGDADKQLALLDRGFQGHIDLIERGRAFYLFDRHIGIPPLFPM